MYLIIFTTDRGTFLFILCYSLRNGAWHEPSEFVFLDRFVAALEDFVEQAVLYQHGNIVSLHQVLAVPLHRLSNLIS